MAENLRKKETPKSSEYIGEESLFSNWLLNTGH